MGESGAVARDVADGSVGEAMRTASAAYHRFADRAAGADRTLPTRLAGWTVGDLVDHVCWGTRMEADAIRSALNLPPSGGGGHALGDAVAAFSEAATLDVAASTAIVLPAGTVPAAYAAPLFAFEAALHDLDLAHALGADSLGAHAETLTASELGACEVVIGPMLDLVAGPVPAEETTIDLVGLGAGLRLRASDSGWLRAVPDGRPATTTISGSAQEIVLFTCGRIGADAVTVVGEHRHAEDFKNYFPGP